jgi:hypothetical protein
MKKCFGFVKFNEIIIATTFTSWINKQKYAAKAESLGLIYSTS